MSPGHELAAVVARLDEARSDMGALKIGLRELTAVVSLAALKHEQRLAPGSEGAVAREVHEQVAVGALLQVRAGQRVGGGHDHHGGRAGPRGQATNRRRCPARIGRIVEGQPAGVTSSALT